MTGTSLAPIVEDYLGRLDAAAWRLPRDRRTELVTEVREHIEAATAGQPGDEAALRTVLDNLGSPEEIAREAVEQEGPPALPTDPTPGDTNLRDIATVLLLMFGGFMFGLGWLVGVALLWSSPRWRTRDKWLGTLVWPFGYAGLLSVSFAGLLIPVQVCTTTEVAGGHPHTTCNGGTGLPDWLNFVLFLVVLFAQVLVAVHLLRTSRKLVAAAHPSPAT